MGRVSVVVLLGGIIGLGRGETNVNHVHGKYQFWWTLGILQRKCLFLLDGKYIN